MLICQYIFIILKFLSLKPLKNMIILTVLTFFPSFIIMKV